MKIKEPKEPVSFWKRIGGLFFGGVAGLVISVILFLVLNLCGVVSGKDRVFELFAIWGSVAGAVLGAIFPRLFITLGHILGQLIPGI
jgi:uncharacterized membrane protein required for colicin V production